MSLPPPHPYRRTRLRPQRFYATLAMIPFAEADLHCRRRSHRTPDPPSLICRSAAMLAGAEYPPDSDPPTPELSVPPVRSPPPTRRGRAGQPYRRAREREPGRCTPRRRKTHGREDPAVPSAHTSHAWMARRVGCAPCVGRHRFRLARSSVDPCMDVMVCSQTFRKV